MRKLYLVIVGPLLFGCSSLVADETEWVNPAGGSWVDDDNWDNNAPGTSDDAFFHLDSSGVVTLGGASIAIDDIQVGGGSDNYVADAYLDLEGGVLNAGTIHIGDRYSVFTILGSSPGRLSFEDGVVSASSVAWELSEPSPSNQLAVGADGVLTTTGSVSIHRGTLIIESGGLVEADHVGVSDLGRVHLRGGLLTTGSLSLLSGGSVIGHGVVTGVPGPGVTATNDSVNFSRPLKVGSDPATVYSNARPTFRDVNLASGGHLTSDRGLAIADAGVLTQTGGSITTNGGEIAIGSGAAASAQYNISGGVVAEPQADLRLGVAANSSGSVTQIGGDIAVRDVVLGDHAGAIGQYDLQGGSLNANLVLTGTGSGGLSVTGGELTAYRLLTPTTFTGGTLRASVIGSSFTQDGGTLKVGNSPGITTFEGDWNFSSGNAEIELFGLNGVAGADFDFIGVAGTADIGGVVDVIDAGLPASAPGGSTWNVIQADEINLTGTVNLPVGFSYSVLDDAVDLGGGLFDDVLQIELTRILAEWQNASGGDFGSAGNWSGGQVPSTFDEARFDLPAANYTVAFSEDVTNDRAAFKSGIITLDLGGNTYNLRSFSTSTFIGESGADNPDLTVTNGTLTGESLTIAAGGSNGNLRIDASGVVVMRNEVVIGSNGALVMNGGSLTASSLDNSAGGALTTILFWMRGQSSEWF